MRAITGSYRRSREASYHPLLLLRLIIYCYAIAVFSSRNLERATYYPVAFRFIAANEHPYHYTIATFRRRFLEQIQRCRAGARLSPRDARVEARHRCARSHQDPRQRQPSQRAALMSTQAGSRRS